MNKSWILILALVGCSNISPAGGEPYRRGMTMITPSSQWREALPTGNGEVGALVYGSVNEETILFNHNELWYMGQTNELPDMSGELAVVRQLLKDGKYREANEHYKVKMRELGFNARNAVYHPACDLLITTDTDKMFEDYRRTLDFETGEAVVQWRDGDIRFSRRLFVSIPDDLSVMTIRADRAGAVSGEATLAIHDLKDAVQQNGQLYDPGFKWSTTVEGEYIVYRADGTDGGEFGAVALVLPQKGSQQTEGNVIRFTDADEVVVSVALFANEPADQAVPRLKKQLKAAGSDYDKLFARHEVLHRAKFNSMGININSTGKRDTPNEMLLLDAYQNPASPELIEKLFDYGRYLLISSSRAGGYPAGLQGIWNGDYRPPWSGLYGINENLQMTYWQSLPGDLEEPIMAFFDYFDAHLDEFRYNARKMWGCRGIYIPPFMSPDSGIMRMTAPHTIYWTDAAGWLASFYYDYYLFTGDEAFLKNRAIPFMKEVALFYEDYMIQDENGKNLFMPSQSPENQPADKVIPDPQTGREYKIKVQINSTIAVAVAKEVFSNLIMACEKLGVEQEGVERWKAALAAMPEYEINEDGALKEWLHPDFKDNYEHRHQSHLYPLFPGQEITEEATPELYEASRVAIEKRLVIGLKSQTGWSLAHMANVYARLGEGDRALDALNILARCCLGQNFFTYHNDWRKMGVTMDQIWGQSAPFQMDANFGIPAAVMEMLCGSTSDMVRILPGLPGKWSTGEFHDMLTRSGARTSAKWNLEEKWIEVVLKAERDTTFDLKFPADVGEVTNSGSGEISESSYGDRYRSVKLTAGDQLKLNIELK